MVTRKIRYHFIDADNSKTPCIAELDLVKPDGFSRTLRAGGATYEEARAKVIEIAKNIPPDEDVEIEPRTEPAGSSTIHPAVVTAETGVSPRSRTRSRTRMLG